MAEKHKITFYPVGKGDTCQVVLANGRRVLFDFCHRKKAEDKSDPRIDLKKRLTDELKDAKRDDFDVVCFSHNDDDHIANSTEFFYLEHSSTYQGEGRFKIKELWVPAAMLLESVTMDQKSKEFAVWRAEARHRLVEGKGIRVFSRPQELADWLTDRLKDRKLPANARDHLFVDAGQLVGGFTLAGDGAEFFCHSPFIKHCDGDATISNEAAIILNVRLQADGKQYDFLQVGDSTWDVLEDIVSKSKKHKNEDRLQWNLYNVPHHCSYRALSDEKGKKETEPKPLVKELLEKGKPDAYLVSCSDPIPDSKDMYDKDQPPHIQARNAYETYRKKVNGRSFLVTMEEPNASKPEPLVFEVSGGGVTWERAVSGAAAIITSTPPRAG